MTTDAPVAPKNRCGGIRVLRLPRMATVLWAMSGFSAPRAAPLHHRKGGVEGIASHDGIFFPVGRPFFPVLRAEYLLVYIKSESSPLCVCTLFAELKRPVFAFLKVAQGHS